MKIERKSPIYDGKSKTIFETDHESLVIQYFKDDATAFNAQKRGTILNKGHLNNQMSSQIFQYLNKIGVTSHFVKQISDREMLVKKLKIIPVEVVVRNQAAGSLCKRLGIERGKILSPPLVEYFLKNDDLGDPLVGEGQIFYFNWATPADLESMKEISLRVNRALLPIFQDLGLLLVDFKLEFGKTSEAELLLADEFSLDGCRLWDIKTGESMDKDRFRLDLGKVDETYEKVSHQLTQYLQSQK